MNARKDNLIYAMAMLVSTGFIVTWLLMARFGYIIKEDVDVIKEQQEREQEEEQMIQVKINDSEWSDSIGVNIPYFGYFVKTAGESFKRINDTHYHEACHELVRKDYYHFCEEYYD